MSEGVVMGWKNRWDRKQRHLAEYSSSATLVAADALCDNCGRALANIRVQAPNDQ